MMNHEQPHSQMIELLIKQGNLRRIKLEKQESEIKSQMDKLQTLNQRFKQCKMDKVQTQKAYLSAYDALFRIVEITLIKGWRTRFAARPHQGFKRLLFDLFPKLTETISLLQLKRLVQTRHHVKKEHMSPSQDDRDLMFGTYERCLNESGIANLLH